MISDGERETEKERERELVQKVNKLIHNGKKNKIPNASLSPN